MPLLKLYLDTSVIGALLDTEDPSRVEITKQLFSLIKSSSHLEGYISNIVIEEIEKAPHDLRAHLIQYLEQQNLSTLFETNESPPLIQEYLKQRIIPQRYRDDARHIAVAVIHDIDVIVTWNCKHMAHFEKKRKINAVNLLIGYQQIDIVTPLEVVGYD